MHRRTPGARSGSYYNRGEARLELGELELARADYLSAIELAREPDVLSVRRHLDSHGILEARQFEQYFADAA